MDFYEHAKQCESTCHLGTVGGGGGGGNILGKKGFSSNIEAREPLEHR